MVLSAMEEIFKGRERREWVSGWERGSEDGLQFEIRVMREGFPLNSRLSKALKELRKWAMRIYDETVSAKALSKWSDVTPGAVGLSGYNGISVSCLCFVRCYDFSSSGLGSWRAFVLPWAAFPYRPPIPAQICLPPQTPPCWSFFVQIPFLYFLFFLPLFTSWLCDISTSWSAILPFF